ncbi:MAG: glycosyltransferase family 2 protein [Ferruginibacter sp.]
MSHTGISVVIPNYNGMHLLSETLPPLFIALQRTGNDYEVIISDDHSTDGSVQFLQSIYPGIIVLESKVNLGFSPTINKGIFITKFDKVLLLNSDVKLSPDYFNGLANYFDMPDTFGVMGRIIGWDDEEIQDGGKYPGFHGAKIKTSGNYIPLHPEADDKLYSMYLSGANALVSRQKLLELGGFDEIFAPFYVEDYEISLRAWRIGYKCYYHHEAESRHKVSASVTSKNRKNFVNAIYYRNKMYLHAMHLEGTSLFLWYLQLLPETLIRLFTFRFYYLQSLAMFFSNHKRMKNSIKKLHLTRDRKDILSVKEVADFIILNLKEKVIKRF